MDHDAILVLLTFLRTLANQSLMAMNGKAEGFFCIAKETVFFTGTL